MADRLRELMGTPKADDGVEMTDASSAADDSKEEKKAKRKSVDESAAKEEKEDESEIAKHMKLYAPLKEHFRVIQEAGATIDRLREQDAKAATDKENKEILAQLEKIMSDTNKRATIVKKSLDDIKKQNDAYEHDKKLENSQSANMQVRRNAYQTNIRKLHSIMTEYNAAVHAFKQASRARAKRRIKIVNKEVSDEQVDKIIDADPNQSRNIIAEALEVDLSELTDLVEELEDRHQAMLRLEQQVNELYELFRDLATIVDIQQDELDVIETRITNAKDYTEQGAKELESAEKYQEKARKRQCILLFIILGVLLAVALPVGISLGKS